MFLLSYSSLGVHYRHTFQNSISIAKHVIWFVSDLDSIWSVTDSFGCVSGIVHVFPLMEKISLLINAENVPLYFPMQK